MTSPTESRCLRALPAVVALLALLPSAAAAQTGSDFLFRRPSGSLGIRVGYAVPRAEGELFDFTREQLTVARSDFNAIAIEGEVAVTASERVDVVLGLGWSRSTTRSEFRHWEGTDDLPIEQTTRFSRVPLTLGFRGYLLERGRRISRFAWVPAAWAPYVGAGVGAIRYAFDQEGEWVDFQDSVIFWERFRSDGWAPTAHVLAGAELTLRPRLVLTGEGRYLWGRTDLSRDFVEFDEIDLSGFLATAGISFRF